MLGPAYGHLPPRIAHALPWQEVAVDLIGPWNVQLFNDSYDFYALTCIDIATGYPDAVRLQNKTAEHVGLQFENLWLSRYPRPLRCIHDPGPEFIGWGFQRVLTRANIRDAPTTVRNPQANAICERLHQSVAKALRIQLNARPPPNVLHIGKFVDTILATALHAVRSTIHTTLGVTPGALVFHRDMFHDIPIHPDFEAIQNKRQAIIDLNLQRQNRRRRDHHYRVNDECLLIEPNPKKLDERAIGPFRIVQLFTNGTVRIQRTENLQQVVNIRQLRPYFRQP